MQSLIAIFAQIAVIPRNTCSSLPALKNGQVITSESKTGSLMTLFDNILMKKLPLVFAALLFFLLSNCHSTQGLQKSAQPEDQLREQIHFYVKCLNEGNAPALEKIYASDYEGISPVTKFENTRELIKLLVESQRQQNLNIEFEIIELSTKPAMAYAVVDWKVFENATTSERKLFYHKKHLQIWEWIDNAWRLKRSLFYN